MSIESIQPIAFPSLAPQAMAPVQDAVSGGFGQMVVQGLEHVNHSLMSSQAGVQALALGNPVNLHEVMVNLEESRLSFQLMMQVRSRLLEAYQDVMRMQV
jgi:flagellar hook-basal body complex protein FliE